MPSHFHYQSCHPTSASTHQPPMRIPQHAYHQQQDRPRPSTSLLQHSPTQPQCPSPIVNKNSPVSVPSAPNTSILIHPCLQNKSQTRQHKKKSPHVKVLVPLHKLIGSAMQRLVYPLTLNLIRTCCTPVHQYQANKVPDPDTHLSYSAQCIPHPVSSSPAADLSSTDRPPSLFIDTSHAWVKSHTRMQTHLIAISPLHASRELNRDTSTFQPRLLVSVAASYGTYASRNSYFCCVRPVGPVSCLAWLASTPHRRPRKELSEVEFSHWTVCKKQGFYFLEWVLFAIVCGAIQGRRYAKRSKVFRRCDREHDQWTWLYDRCDRGGAKSCFLADGEVFEKLMVVTLYGRCFARMFESRISRSHETVGGQEARFCDKRKVTMMVFERQSLLVSYDTSRYTTHRDSFSHA